MLRDHVANVAREEMPGAGANPDDPRVANQAKARVLLVDDDSDPRLVLGRFLAEEDNLVVTAANGDEALEFSKATKFDIALLDFKMSATNGPEAFELFSQENPLLPIIPVTTRPTQLSPSSASDICAQMQKPFDFMRVFHTAQNLLEKSDALHFSRMTGQHVVFEHITSQKAQARMSDASIQVFSI